MSAMTREKMLELLAAYGANLARWPQTYQSAANQYLDTADQALLDQFAEEERLDDILAGAAADPMPTIALEEALLRDAPLPKSHAASSSGGGWLKGLLQPSAPRWAAVSGMALAMVFGAGAGYAGARNDADSVAAVEAYAYAAPDTSFSLEAFSIQTGDESS